MPCRRRRRILEPTMRRAVLTLFGAALLVLAALPASAQARADAVDYERVGKLIYGVQRLESMTGADAIAQHGLAGRIAALTLERDAIVKVQGRVPAAQLDAALRELQAINVDLAR